MRDLPAGTVTFLFADVEGSTRFLNEVGAEAYATALANHRRVLRDVFARFGGVEVDTQGDAFFVAFPTAPAAVEAARSAQENLAGFPLSVRIGVHTGTPLLTEEGYVGSDVHRAARIASAGHGGQVLVSGTTRALLESSLPLTDLGAHRLKDLEAAERIFQLGEVQFPPLKSLYRTNLPIPSTPFIGRERELDEVVEYLTADAVRLLTLTGPGGIGKTRLALQAAAEAADVFPDGVFWVPLAPLRDPALVLGTARQALLAKSDLLSHVADKRLLLLFDNFEHVMPAARELASLLASCPNLRMLVTSREALRVGAEQLYAVPSLQVSEAVKLFAARAGAVVPGYRASAEVREVCAQLDMLPLAIELAAARMALFTASQLLERLGERLDTLKAGRDADPRQRTLRATIEWSYALLGEEERRLFAHLAVFAGGCTYGAAETVCEADAETLESLLDKSLVRRSDHDQPRYWMLATIHEYASQLLAEAPDVEPVRRRHAEHFLRLAERAEPELFEGDQRRWARTLATEHDNIRGALAWADAADPTIALRLALAMSRFWALRGYVSEGQSWLARALDHDVDSALRSRALAAAGLLARIDGNWARVRQLDEEAVRLAKLSGDARTMALSLNGLTAAAGFTGDWELALRYGLEARDIALSIGDARTAGGSHFNLGDVALHLGRFDEAIDHGRRALTLLREVGNRELLALSFSVIGLSALETNDRAQAARSFRESLLLAGELQFAEAIAASAEGLAALAESPARAARLLGIAEGVRGALPARPAFERRRQRTEAGLRERLGDDHFATLLREGREMRLEDALGYAAGA